jgi:hypothetical protein
MAFVTMFYQINGDEKMNKKNQASENGQLVLNKTCRCDICGNNIRYSQGYLLPTYKVLIEKAYWHFYFENVVKKQIAMEKLDQKTVMASFFHFATIDSPYIVCEKCSKMFSFERGQAKKAAEIWWQTEKPDSGFALCKHHYSWFKQVDEIEPLDVENLRKAFTSTLLALRPYNPKLAKTILEYHTTRKFGYLLKL